MTNYLGKVVSSVRVFGLRTTLRRVRNKLFGVQSRKLDTGFVLSANVRMRQSSQVFPRQVSFSVLVPLYNTPPTYLKAMIDSVFNQTYVNWELCLADASDSSGAAAAPTYVQRICREYANRDARIKYQKLASNEGIANNTNRCIQMASGDYLALLDHDDVLHPSALFELAQAINEQGADLLYTDEITFTEDPRKGYNVHFKPDFSPDTLRSYNYITHLTAFSRELQQKVGGLHPEFDGSQDYDLILRLSEKAENIAHIPKVLYYWRAHPKSVAAGIEAKLYAIDAAKSALSEHLQRVGLRGQVKDAAIPTVYRIEYYLSAMPLVSIIIPSKDHIEDLDTCLRSIVSKSTYKNIEIIIVENNSTEPGTFSYYESLPVSLSESWLGRIEVLTWEGAFNFSAINNFAARAAQGEYLLFLNNDTQVITQRWIEELLMFAQRSDVAAVGAKLLYPDNTIQHAGVVLGIGGVAAHVHRNFHRDDFGYVSRLQLAQNVSANTAACLLVSRQKFEQVGGFDEGYEVAFNDIDFCMKLRKAGYLNVFTPFAELYHHESKSRGYEDNPAKLQRFKREIQRFQTIWMNELAAGDPYYNQNLTLEREDFSLRISDMSKNNA